METIYNWLLHNTGNEGNYYTILNSQHTTMPEGTDYLSVMARLADFKVKDLLIYAGQKGEYPTAKPDWLAGKVQPESLTFGNPQEVIDYLSTGKTAEPVAPANAENIQVLVVEPIGAAGEITFPPK